MAGLILEDDYFFNPEISTKDPDEDIVASTSSTGGEISPVRGDSSLSTSSGIGSGSGIHSSPSPSPSSSSSTSLDVGSYDTSSSTSSTSSGRNRHTNGNKSHHHHNHQPKYTHLDNHQEDSNSTTTITVSKGSGGSSNGVVSSSSKNSLYERATVVPAGQSDKKVGWSPSSSSVSTVNQQQLLPAVDCGEGPVRVSRWTGGNSNNNNGGTETEVGNNSAASNNNDPSSMPIPFVQAPLREEDAERISGKFFKKFVDNPKLSPSVSSFIFWHF